MFFSEKKTQKSFTSCAASTTRAIFGGTHLAANTPEGKQKFFGSFFQKRTSLFFLLLLSFNAQAAPRLFIEDNDFAGPGGSNIQSVLPLIADQGIRVLGFTVVTGDGWCDEEAAYLLRFLEIAHRTDIPVYKGAVFPLVNSFARQRVWEQAYGTLPWKGAWNAPQSNPGPGLVFHPEAPFFIPDNPSGNPTTKPASGDAVRFLIEQVHRYPHQVTILAAGPMTNLALAIRLDPDFPKLARELVFMGGMLDNNIRQVTVNADWYVDFNFLFDPEAAHIVLTAPWANITSLGSVTNDTMMSIGLTARMLAVRTPVTEYLAKYAQTLPLWDELAAAVAVDPSLITQHVDAVMDVETDHGMGYGQARIWAPEMAPHQGEQMVRVVQAVDLKRFYDSFVRAAQAVGH